MPGRHRCSILHPPSASHETTIKRRWHYFSSCLLSVCFTPRPCKYRWVCTLLIRSYCLHYCVVLCCVGMAYSTSGYVTASQDYTHCDRSNGTWLYCPVCESVGGEVCAQTQFVYLKKLCMNAKTQTPLDIIVE